MKADIILINEIEKEHLEEVKTEMKSLGSPTIKAVYMEVWGAWVALEGTHRVTAAIEMGLEIIIEEVEYNEEIEVNCDLGIEDAPMYQTVAEFCDSAYQSAEYTIEANIIIN